MFAVQITTEAKAFLDASFRESGLLRGGVMISRKGATADVKRSPKGGTVWTIERPENPWSIETGSFEGYRDDELLMIDGIFVCLALIPKDGERGVIIGVRDGELCIDSLGA